MYCEFIAVDFKLRIKKTVTDRR